MSDEDQCSSSPHESPTTEGQGALFDSMFPSSQTYIENDVKSVIEFLNIRLQQVNDNAEVMKELIHQRQSMMANPNIEHVATLPIPKGGAILELGFGGSNLDAFQGHLSPGLSMDIPHHADALDGAGYLVSVDVAGQHLAWAALSHVMQTSMTEIGDKSLPYREVAGYQTFTPVHGFPPQSTNLAGDYGHASEIGFGSTRTCFPGQTLSPAALTYASDNRDGHARSSVSAPPRNEVGGPTVLCFMFNGIKHYRCECGYESVRKGDIDHHLESLLHSERKYECFCGKKFTRYDSLHRHRKRKMQKSMGSGA